MANYRGGARRSDEWRTRQEQIGRRCQEQIQRLQNEPDARRNLRRLELPASSEPVQRKFAAALKLSDTVLFQAATGAGKSLDIGAMLRKAHPEVKRIAMNQPRRDAAEGVCVASCARHNWQFGRDCCYSTSEFKGNRTDTALQIMTTAILLNKFKTDLALREYDAVIIDEAHERDLYIDLTFGLVMQAQELRQAQGLKPLKIIVASATVDQAKFKNYLGCPNEAVFDIEGRMFPVQEHYLRDEELFTKETNRDGSKIEQPVSSIAGKKAVEILKSTSSGDILIFMPGIRTIEDTMRNLEAAKEFGEIPQNVEVLRLYSADGLAARQEVLRGSRKGGPRRVIVSTNMAETSVTVPGIRYVIDGCRKNQPEFDQASGLEGLKEVPASKAECRQRKGRAGRVAAGDYYCCLTKERYDELEEYPRPEILRLELTSVILRMLGMGIKDLEQFQFLDRPTDQNIQAALMTLEGLGAIDTIKDRNLSEIGRRMAELPIEPRLARMLIEAEKFGCVREVALMSALARESGDILRYRPQRDELANAEAALADLPGTITRLQDRQNLAEPESYEARRLGKIIEILTEEQGRSSRIASKAGEIKVTSEQIRELAKKILLAKQRPLRAGYNSDWQLYIDLMQQYRTAANKEDFCFSRGLDSDSMLQAQEAYEQLTYELEDKGIEMTSRQDPQAIIKSLLPAYAPDYLVHQTGGRRGVEYERVYYGDRAVRLSSASAAYDDKPGLFVCLNLDPEKGTKTIGRGRTEETVWKYATGIHPVDVQALHQAMPHRVKRERPSSYQIDGEGNVVLTSFFSFKNKKGEWSKIGEGAYTEACPESGWALAKMLVENYSRDTRLDLEFFHLAENKAAAQYFEQWQKRAGFYRRHTSQDLSLAWTSLTDWYAERIGRCANLTEVLAKGSDYYQLNVAEWISDERVEWMNQAIPAAVTLNGLRLPIEYNYSPGRPDDSWEAYRQDRDFRVSVTVDGLSYINKMNLPDTALADIRALISGSIETDQVYLSGYPTIAEFKEQTNENYLRDAWSKWKKPQAQALELIDDQPLPELSTLDILPQPYAQDWQGQPVMAYPAIHGEQSGRYDTAGRYEYYNQYSVRYYQTTQAAQQHQEQAATTRADELAKRQRARDRETLLVPAQELYAQVEPRVTTAVKDYEQFGFSSSEAQDLNTRLQEANISIQGRDRWGSVHEVDPRKALELLRALEQTLADRERSKQGQTELYEQATVVRDRVQQLVTEKLAGNRFRHYGLAEDRGRALQAQWDTAWRLVSRPTPGRTTDDFNPAEAIRIMVDIEQVLMPLELNTSPVQVAYLEMLDYGKNGTSRARLIEVRGGMVVRSTNLEGTEDTLRMYRGESNKGDKRRIVMGLGTYKRMYMRGNKLTAWSRSGRTYDAHYELPDGLYVVGQDNEVFQVSRQAGQLIAQRRLESTEINYDQTVYPTNMGDYDTDEDWLPVEQEVQPDGPEAEPASIDQLVAVFGGVKGKRGADRPEVTQVPETPTQPAVEVKPVEAEVMTPELLAYFTEQVKALQSLADQLKTLGEKPQLRLIKRPTDKDRALHVLYDKLIPGLNEATSKVQGELTSTDPRPERMRSFLAEVRRRVDSAWDKTGPRIIAGYRKNWTQAYLNAWEGIPAVVDDEENAILAIEGGADKTALIGMVRESLIKLIPRLQKEDTTAVLDLPAIVADVANKLS